MCSFLKRLHVHPIINSISVIVITFVLVLLTMFLPPEIRFCRLLLGVISRLELRSHPLVVVARGILGTPALAKAARPLDDPPWAEMGRLSAKPPWTIGAGDIWLMLDLPFSFILFFFEPFFEALIWGRKDYCVCHSKSLFFGVFFFSLFWNDFFLWL